MGSGSLIWRHVVLSTKGRWLHADPRGFRTRGHRIHSSGDYKDRPPAGEHAGLWRYQKDRCPDEVVIPEALRLHILHAFVARLLDGGWRVLAASCADRHLHPLVELPASPARTKEIAGDAKRVASKSVRTEMPGSVWAAGGAYKPIRSREHQLATFRYIVARQEVGAYTWGFHKPLGPTRPSRDKAREATSVRRPGSPTTPPTES